MPASRNERFLGYRLIDSVPEFRYSVDGVSVNELIAPVEGGFVRRFRIEDVDRPMWFVPASADGFEIRSTLDEFVIPSGESIEFEVTVIAR